MKKEKATFTFSESYRGTNYSLQEATVILDVNYSSKTYSIKPYSSCDQSFKFLEGSHQWEMWKAVLKAIDAAIDFANQEVGNTTKKVEIR